MRSTRVPLRLKLSRYYLNTQGCSKRYEALDYPWALLLIYQTFSWVKILTCFFSWVLKKQDITVNNSEQNSSRKIVGNEFGIWVLAKRLKQLKQSFIYKVDLIVINITMRQIQTDPHQNQGIRRNAIIFGVLTLTIHVLACFMFGFFFRLPAQMTAGVFIPLFVAFAYGMFIIVGFGLLFSYLKKMIWTGMGFTLLITALSIEMYFMMNCFWTKAVIWYKADPAVRFADQNKLYNFWLTNLNEAAPHFLATLTGGFRCALSNVIAFSAIMGRAGPLEALFVVIFGTIGYELNRQIIENYNVDSGGSNAIFVFGGFMGLSLGLLKYIKERNPEASTSQHHNYSGNRSSAAFALIGTLLTWIFFPILAMDYLDQTVSSTPVYTGPYGVIFALCSATITSFCLSALMNNGIVIRDVIYGPIAGGVASATASFWVVNPVYTIVIGVVSATIQVVVMNLIEKRIARSSSIFNTFSFTLFGIQGMVGAVFSAIWSAGTRSNKYEFTYNIDDNNNQVFNWIISLISLPMGLLFGAAAGALILAVNTHRREDHFDDFTYWVNDDGIRMFQEGVAPDLGVRVKSHVIKGRKAYL